MVKDRATTPEQKREILDRLYQIWCQPGVDQLRLGQMLIGAFGAVDIFDVEDYTLVAMAQRRFGLARPGLTGEFDEITTRRHKGKP